VALASTGISIQNTGSGAAHDNKQPVIAAYFIIYLP
jgi:microcystin-dependent protein